MINSSLPLVSYHQVIVIILMMAGATSCFVLFYLLGKVLLRPSHLEERLREAYTRALVRKRQRIGNISVLTDILHQGEKAQPKQKISLVLRGFFDSVFHRPILKIDNVKLLFEQAGWSPRNAHILYILGKGASFSFIMALFFIYSHASASALKFKVLFFLVALFIGWNLFDVILKHIIKDRVEHIEREFPNALDLMLICVSAGLGFQKSIERVAREIARYDKTIAHELALTSIELEIFLDNRQALLNLSARVPSPIIRIFVTSLLQSLYQGTSILTALDALSRETRVRRVERIEEKVAKLPSLMVIPLVLFTLPNVFIILLGPSLSRIGNMF